MRNKLLSLIVTFTLMVGLMAIPAKAGEGEWNFAVGLKAITGDLDTSGSEHEYDTVTGKATHEVNKAAARSATAEFGAIFAEVAGRDGILGFTSGFEYIPGSASLGSASRTDTDLSGGSEGGTSKTYTAKAEVEQVMTFYVEPTIYFSDNFGLYAKGGVTSLDLKTLESLSAGTDSSTYPDKTMYGGVIGAGIRYVGSNGLLIKLEHTETNFKPYDETSITGNKNRIKAELDYSATSLAIGWQF